MIEVLNGRVDGWVGEGQIYIGRKNNYKGLEESVLGNIYKVGVDGNRDEVVEKYRVWLWNECKKKGEVWLYLKELGKRVKQGETVKLTCWCAPKNCHGFVIKRCVEWMVREGLI